ncbi:GntR family transcriptional regulator [Leucothrix mucor]|uniref:GntR family transcriptional regulator n=1 Tax=Leucothrix mucor TaxID=45248 RepID=UPI0012FB6C6F|nr:GntR family transcriptional regulator [Leucothrix mucor]
MLGESKIEPMTDATLRQRVVTKLRALIVSGDLAPGQRLTETKLATALNISRAPLREAIRELVDIGLLVSLPYKGLFVKTVTRDDLEEIYSLRTALEKLAFEQCWDKRTEAACEDLRRRNAELVRTIDSDEAPLLNIEQELTLHSWCFELAGHKLLMQAWERMKPNLQLYFTLHQQAHNRKGPSRDAHDEYVRLACGDDLNAMTEYLSSHMRQGLATTLASIE